MCNVSCMQISLLKSSDSDFFVCGINTCLTTLFSNWKNYFIPKYVDDFFGVRNHFTIIENSETSVTYNFSF